MAIKKVTLHGAQIRRDAWRVLLILVCFIWFRKSNVFIINNKTLTLFVYMEHDLFIIMPSISVILPNFQESPYIVKVSQDI
jgi:hypothetical protein